MTVGELAHGRGTPMSAHELTVLWPAYHAVKHREAERIAKEQKEGLG